MNKTINTDFSCNDKVWIWKNNIPVETIIDRIVIDISAFTEIKFHVQADDSDYFRYEEDLFSSEKELMEAMSIKTIKLDKSTLKKGKLIKCNKAFTSFEGDKFTEDWTFCIIKICKRHLIVRGNGRTTDMDYYLLTDEEVVNNFKLYRAKWSGPKINTALKMMNVDTEDDINEVIKD